MAFENALRGLGLTPQSAGEYGIKSNVTPAEIAAEKACLRKAYVGEAVVMIRAEGRLPVAYKIDGSHVLELKS